MRKRSRPKAHCPRCNRIKSGDNVKSIALFNQCCACYLDNWVKHTSHFHYDGDDEDSNDYLLKGEDAWIGLIDPNTGALGADLYINLTEEGVILDLYGRIGIEHSPETEATTWARWDEMAYATTGTDE